MPKQINDHLWECQVCKKQFDRILYAKSCEDSHSIIYVPLTVKEIDSLIQFIFTGEKKLLNEGLTKKLLSYMSKGRKEALKNG